MFGNLKLDYKNVKTIQNKYMLNLARNFYSSSIWTLLGRAIWTNQQWWFGRSKNTYDPKMPKITCRTAMGLVESRMVAKENRPLILLFYLHLFTITTFMHLAFSKLTSILIKKLYQSQMKSICCHTILFSSPNLCRFLSN